MQTIERTITAPTSPGLERLGDQSSDRLESCPRDLAAAKPGGRRES